MKTRVSLGLVLLLVLFSTLSGQAQEPEAQAILGTAFTYQGQLKDGGAAVQGTCDFQFSLWDTVTGGSQIGATQTKGNVSVTKGLFTTQIDFGVGSFQGDARWLGIKVRCPAGSGTYVTLSPRQALTPAPYALALPGLWTQPNGTSPNIIGGHTGNTVTSGVVGATISGGGASGNTNRVTDNHGTIGGGFYNQAGDNAGTVTDSAYATVAGGLLNFASGAASAVGGGGVNVASGGYATVSGGNVNVATGSHTTVGGGWKNAARSSYATVGGGSTNVITATAEYATIGGGKENTASGMQSTIAGGAANTAGYRATVGGGLSNSASGQYATVPGGYLNVAGGTYSFAAGQRAKANHQGAFVWADTTSTDFASTAANQFAVRATGGVRFVSDGFQIHNSAGLLAFAVDQNGTARTRILEITGGSDLAEPFAIIGADSVEPGTVVAIDPVHPGQLRAASKAYDRAVAGCVSGANGIQPGLIMQQSGTVAEEAFPVALSGRVYCWADATYGPIVPGDLLTTSETPGHAMNATDSERSFGSVIGKAMSPLETGRGLVLVLVTLQ